MENQEISQDVALNEVDTQVPPEAPISDKKLLKELLSDDLKAHKSLASFLDKNADEALPELVKSYVNAQTLVGKKVSQLSEAELRQLVDLPQRPEGPESYKLLLADVELDLIDEQKEVMFQLGLDAKQAKKFVERLKEDRLNNQALNEQKNLERAEQADAVLHEEFGLKFRSNMEVAKQAALSLGGAELQKKIFDAPIKDPEMIKLLYKVGKELVTPEVVSASPRHVESADMIRDEINRLTNDKAFYRSWSQGDQKAAMKMDQLYQKLHAIEIGGK